MRTGIRFAAALAASVLFAACERGSNPSHLTSTAAPLPTGAESTPGAHFAQGAILSYSCGGGIFKPLPAVNVKRHYSSEDGRQNPYEIALATVPCHRDLSAAVRSNVPADRGRIAFSAVRREARETDTGGGSASYGSDYVGQAGSPPGTGPERYSIHVVRHDAPFQFVSQNAKN